MVAADVMRRGYKLAFPYGEDWDFDLVVCRDGITLERVQVKYSTTSDTIDWLAVYDVTTDCCYYLPAEMVGTGMSLLHLRLRKPRNNQRIGVRFAADYLEI